MDKTKLHLLTLAHKLGHVGYDAVNSFVEMVQEDAEEGYPGTKKALKAVAVAGAVVLAPEIVIGAAAIAGGAKALSKLREAGKDALSSARAGFSDDERTFLKGLTNPYTIGVTTVGIQLDQFNRSIEQSSQ